MVIHSSCANCDRPLPPPPEPEPPREMITSTDGRFAFDDVPATSDPRQNGLSTSLEGPECGGFRLRRRAPSVRRSLCGMVKRARGGCAKDGDAVLCYFAVGLLKMFCT